MCRFKTLDEAKEEFERRTGLNYENYSNIMFSPIQIFINRDGYFVGTHQEYLNHAPIMRY